MTRASFRPSWRRYAATLLLPLVGGCGVLQSASTPPPAFYSLDRTEETTVPVSLQGARTLTLIVSSPQAASGFDSQRIIYTRRAHKLEYFAHSEWIDTPARMLAPMIVAALQGSSAFRVVVLSPSTALGELRLDTEILRLQHDFSQQPSRVHFTLRAHLIDNKTRRVIRSREFDASTPASSDDPYGGVVAANRVVRHVLVELAAFCSDAGSEIPPER